jgi:hypothetical protein
MSTPRHTLNVPDPVHARLFRLAQLYGKPANWLVDRFSAVFENQWKEFMTDAQWRRYCRDDISDAEAARIREARQIKQGAKLAVVVNGGGNQRLSDDFGQL